MNLVSLFLVTSKAGKPGYAKKRQIAVSQFATESSFYIDPKFYTLDGKSAAWERQEKFTIFHKGEWTSESQRHNNYRSK